MKLAATARRHSKALLAQVSHRAKHLAQHPECTFSKPLLESASRMYLSSAHAKAFQLQWINGSVRDGKFTPQPFGDAFEAAKDIDLFRPYKGEINFYELRNKNNGKLRQVVRLPSTLKLSHRMADALIKEQFCPGRHIYNWKGKGTARLLHDMIGAFELGFAHVLLADVNNCYDSIDFKAVYDLKLFPNDFVAAQLDLRQMKFRRNACEHLAGEVGERAKVCSLCSLAGIAEPDGQPRFKINLVQGSPASNALLAVLFDDLPRHLPEGILCFIFGDNIALLAKNEVGLVAAKEALVNYYRHHVAGRLSLKFLYEGLARSGFEHLGYRVGLREGHWTVGHSDANFYRMMHRIVARFPVKMGAEEYHGQQYAITRDDALSVFGEFTSGFPALTTDRQAEVFEFLMDEEFNV